MKATILIFLLSFALNAVSQVKLEPLHVDDIEYGCGCTFSPAGTKAATNNLLLMWEGNGPAKMRINGRVETLVVSGPKTTRRADEEQRVGDRLLYELRSPRWLVVADCAITQVCTPKDGPCEAVTYKAKLRISSGKTKSVVAASGICGC